MENTLPGQYLKLYILAILRCKDALMGANMACRYYWEKVMGTGVWKKP